MDKNLKTISLRAVLALGAFGSANGLYVATNGSVSRSITARRRSSKVAGGSPV